MQYNYLYPLLNLLEFAVTNNTISVIKTNNNIFSNFFYHL